VGYELGSAKLGYPYPIDSTGKATLPKYLVIDTAVVLEEELWAQVQEEVVKGNSPLEQQYKDFLVPGNYDAKHLTPLLTLPPDLQARKEQALEDFKNQVADNRLLWKCGEVLLPDEARVYPIGWTLRGVVTKHEGTIKTRRTIVLPAEYSNRICTCLLDALRYIKQQDGDSTDARISQYVEEREAAATAAAAAREAREAAAATEATEAATEAAKAKAHTELFYKAKLNNSGKGKVGVAATGKDCVPGADLVLEDGTVVTVKRYLTNGWVFSEPDEEKYRVGELFVPAEYKEGPIFYGRPFVVQVQVGGEKLVGHTHANNGSNNSDRRHSGGGLGSVSSNNGSNNSNSDRRPLAVGLGSVSSNNGSNNSDRRHSGGGLGSVSSNNGSSSSSSSRRPLAVVLGSVSSNNGSSSSSSSRRPLAVGLGSVSSNNGSSKLTHSEEDNNSKGTHSFSEEDSNNSKGTRSEEDNNSKGTHSFSEEDSNNSKGTRSEEDNNNKGTHSFSEEDSNNSKGTRSEEDNNNNKGTHSEEGSNSKHP
ncbi:hypothetical protein TrCOL_g12049, partial [Triparma columacea]